MANAKIDLAKLIRHIQDLERTAKTPVEFEEIDFYRTLFSTISESMQGIGNLIPIKFPICSFENASRFAQSLGLLITQGYSGTIYIGWADKVSF